METSWFFMLSPVVYANKVSHVGPEIAQVEGETNPVIREWGSEPCVIKGLCAASSALTQVWLDSVSFNAYIMKSPVKTYKW